MEKANPLRRFMKNRAVPNKVPNSVRVREMRDVKDYNMKQQQRVFDMEKRQVASEQESIKPIDSRDAGAAFKLQTYISKLQQILGQKADLFSQLSASPFTDLNQLKGTTKQAGLLTMLVSKSEFVQAYNEMVAYVSLFFKDIQLDNRVRDRMYATYFTPLTDQMKQLSQQYPDLFKDLPAPERARGNQPPTRTGSVYDLVRKETSAMYSLLNVAADNIQDGIFRPIGAKDVLEYAADNQVNQIFAKNPPPPGPIIQSQASKQAEQAIQMSQQYAEREQQAAMARSAEIAERNPYDPRGDPTLDPQTQARYMAVQADLAEGGLGPESRFPIRSGAEVREDIRAGQMTAEEATQYFLGLLQLGVHLGAFSQADYQAAIVAANAGDEGPANRLLAMAIPQVQMYNDWITSRGVLAPPGEQPPVEPAPAPGPGERTPRPAPAPELEAATPDEIDTAVLEFVANSNFPADERLPDADSGGGTFGGERWRPIHNIESLLRSSFNKRARYIKQIKQAIARYNATIPKKTPGKKPKQPKQPPSQGQQAGPAQQAAPQYDSFTIAQANSPDARGIVAAILKAEERKGGLLDSQSQSDADEVLKILEKDNKAIFDDVMASQSGDRALARMDVVLPLITAVNSAKRAASRNDGRPEGDYVGLGMSGGNFFKNLNEYLEQQGVVPKKEHTLESLANDAIMGATKWAGKTLWDTFTGNGQRRVYEPRELDFVPARQLNSAAPPVSFGYGSHHRPKFAWELEQEAAGPRYVRQDRVPYNVNGGLGMVNPDAEIGTYQVLRMAGEVGRGMSGGVYLPQEYQVLPRPEVKAFGYGCDGDEDVYGYGASGYGSLKRRLSMVNPFADSHDYHYKKVQTGYDDADDFAYGNHEEPLEASQQAHEEEEEKPVDLDENPNPFRVRNENYKVNTGKMKKVSYKMPNM